MSVEEYTSPELCVERDMARRQRAKVTAAGGCPYCIHRVDFLGKSTCDLPHRTFPRCISTPGLGFEPDRQKLQGKCHAPE
jgi:hypothetical protein